MRANGDTHGDTNSATPEAPPKAFAGCQKALRVARIKFESQKNPGAHSPDNFLAIHDGHGWAWFVLFW